MRSLIIALILSACAADLGAQEQTLLSLRHADGGFGGPVVKFTSINQQSAVMIGGRGGWVFDHTFVVGGGGYGIVSEVDASADILPIEGPLDIEFGCLGLELEYIIEPSSLAHYSIYTFIGVGATNFVKDVGPVSRSNQQAGETAFMFILEPAANMEVNVAEWCRLNTGVSYRIALGSEQVGLTDNDFTGLCGSFTLKFGTF